MRSRNAFYNLISSVLLQIVTIICGFIIPKLIIQKYGSNVNGLVASITQFLGYIILLDSGIGQVLKATLYKPIANGDKSEIEKILKASEKFFRTIAYIFIGYIAVLCIIMPTILKGQFNEFYTLSLIIIISISTFAEYFLGMTYRIYLQAKQQTYIISTIQMITTILNSIVVIALILNGANIQIVKLVSSLIFVLRPIIQNIYVKKKYQLNLKTADANYVLKNKWDGFAQHIAMVIHNNTDIAILTFLSSVTEVSVYSVYMLVITGIKNLISAVTNGIDATFGDMIARGEKEILNQRFRAYELFYYTLITIVFIVTFIMIIPFVDVYTKGITDADYHRPLFASIILIAEFCYVIRVPYSSLTIAAGKFKETRNGAIFEAASNLIISILLCLKWGIIGVAIGTLVSMFIRTVEFILYSSANILERSVKEVVKRFLLVVFQFFILITCANVFLTSKIENYYQWIICSIIVTLVTSIVCILSNVIIYRMDTRQLLDILKNGVIRRNKGENIND